MWAYIIRRTLLTIPTVLGIVVLTFILFALVASDPARAYAGKNPSPATLAAIRTQMGIDKPRWINLGPEVVSILAKDNELRIETDLRHGLAEGQEVRLSGVSPADLNATYSVKAVDSANVFRVSVPPGMVILIPQSQPSTGPASAVLVEADASAEARLTTRPGGHVLPAGGKARAAMFFDSQFFDLLLFRFQKSMRTQQTVWSLIATKGPISLAVQLPAFLIAIGLQLVIALYVAASRGKGIDYAVTVATVLTLSVPTISVYLLLQYWMGERLQVFPVAGWSTGIYAWQFAALPILAMVIVEVGGGARFYRTVALDEINADYIRTARAKGALRGRVLFTHVLRNVMIPVITNTVTALPFLVFGALILEAIFQIPGLGGLLVQSIFAQDRSVVMAITYIISIAYCVALLVNDILYTIADPRIALR